jgi:single-stranded DNA-binding protein
MNSATFIGTLLSQPELRYTTDNQTPIAKATFQFHSRDQEPAPANICIVAYGNVSEALKGFQRGQRVAVEGALRMNTVERKDGYKEKVAELSVSRIHEIGENLEVAEDGYPT